MRVKAIVSKAELRNHIQAKWNAKEEYGISKECATMDAATERVYQDLISECMCMEIVLEGSGDYELAEIYREKGKELIKEFEYLKTDFGWSQYLKHKGDIANG